MSADDDNMWVKSKEKNLFRKRFNYAFKTDVTRLCGWIIRIITTRAPIFSKIKLSGMTRPRDLYIYIYDAYIYIIYTSVDTYLSTQSFWTGKQFTLHKSLYIDLHIHIELLIQRCSS